ncbi:hypothetical protein [Ideonella sp. YS5]|uniref:hypothetical protein n=1 Tax=Ideonella sp. YS5 TaxID=3453714 RepID=UPI003EEBA128
MMQRTLNAVQVAALLVSASYGIGFLFGSGELALQHGMGGSIYGLATALGMLLLTIFAARLWRTGMPIWDLFGRAYGSALKNCVALLSVIWMAGVLAAQVHGGVAIVKLLGLGEVAAYALVLPSIFLASRMNLQAASAVFACFLAASGLVLIYALVTGQGGAIYIAGPVRLVADLPTFRPGALIAIVIAVVALVCTGADYHQFVLAAKAPKGAVLGCLLAGLCLVAVSFLPASIVLGLKEGGNLAGLDDPKQVIPFALLREAGRFGSAFANILLVGLSAAALGSGAAILRAMTSALGSATEGRRAATDPRLAAVALGIGTFLALRDQGIVATMVSVNVVYIGSITAVFAALLSGHVLTSKQAGTTMLSGFVGSFGVYVADWAGSTPGWGDSDLLSLAGGLVASTMVLGAQSAGRRANRLPS